jgi:thioredoxin reductase
MERFDLVIIGAGPGGVQLAIRLEEIKKRTGTPIAYCLIEKECAPGSFFESFPVHGTLISNNKLYSRADPRSRFAERFDWNSLVTEDSAILARDYSLEFYPRREIIVEMLRDLCSRHDLPIRYGTRVIGIRKQADGDFLVETDGAAVKAQFAVVATGLEPLTAEIPGIELATPYAEMRPAAHYRDMRVLIIGKGNSGFECAKDILNEAAVIMVASRHPVRFAYQTHYVGHVRSTNAVLVENYQLKHNSAILDCEILKIEGSPGGYDVTVAYAHANGETETLKFDDVIAATGFKGRLDTVAQTLPTPLLHGKFPDIDGQFGCRGIDGLFFAGALTHGPDYRGFSSSGFIHGFRYNSIALAHHLAARLGVSEPHVRIPADEFLDLLMQELENDAAIYLQSGHIGRCFSREPDGAWLDLGYRTRQWFGDVAQADSRLLLVTLEYGDIHAFPDMMRIPRYPGDPERSVHIHPVIRAYDGATSQEVHLEESLLNRFGDNSATRLRLARFLEMQAGAASAGGAPGGREPVMARGASR